MGGKKYDAGIKILEESPIYPASGSLSPESLPLTILDRLFILVGPVQRVFFYDLPSSVPDFVQQRLPQLKLSLSLALREFRPLAGTVHNSGGDKSEFKSSDGDSVLFTVAESDDDFYDLSGSEARDSRRLYPLLPSLGSGDGNSLLALQITLFPGAGVALGVTICHSVADGTTSAHFLKTWAAACRQEMGGIPPGGPPSYDRSVIRVTPSFERVYLQKIKQLDEAAKEKKMDVQEREDIVFKTFTFSREQIKKMGEEFESKTGITGSSSFILTSGFIWSCLVKAKGGAAEKPECFGFVFDARARMKPPVPEAYFGNCLGFTGGDADVKELRGEEGIVNAWTVIWKTVTELKEGDALKVSEDWASGFSYTSYSGILSVAGSPRLGMYQVDFGWGAPRKVEIISIESSGAISLAEGGEDRRGVEVGLALPRDHMGRVSAIVAGRLAEIC